jgi:hypothetical protein
MTGVVTVGHRDFPDLVGASKFDEWTRVAADRMAELGAPRGLVKFLAHHVEVKAVMMMISNYARRGSVTINHAPCGSEPDSKTKFGCHQYLPELLPAGRTLTVYGTTQNGEPFEHTYEGTATS